MEKLKPITHSAFAVAELIDKTNWANNFDWDEVRTLGRYFSAYEAKPGQVIFYEGANADYMGLIISGAIRISKTGADYQVRELAVLQESQTFGELSLIDGAPRSGLAEAIETTKFVITTKRKLLSLSEQDPTLAFKVLWKISETISKRLRHTSFRILDVPAQEE